jgi:hypothetical protein
MQKPNSRPRQRSPIWHHWVKPKGKKHVICKHCNKKLAFSHGSTSNFWYHTEKKHPSVLGPAQLTLVDLQPFATAKQLQLSLEVARWIIEDLQPIFTVEKKCFRLLLTKMQPRFIAFGKNKLLDILYKLYLGVKAKARFPLTSKKFN